MQLVKCLLRPGNDKHTVVPKGDGPPFVSFAETYVLAAIHGPGTVMNIEPVGEIESTSEEEYGRLFSLYGPIVEKLFPGINPQIPMEMPVAKATGKKGAKPQVDEP
jgi:hypothetical protein